MRRSRVEKREERLNYEAEISKVSTLARVKAEAEAKERAAKEISSKIKARTEAEPSERERVEL